MNYITGTENAKLWGISERMVRKYCCSHRITEILFYSGNVLPVIGKNHVMVLVMWQRRVGFIYKLFCDILLQISFMLLTSS